jgi:hypothetical protein
MSEPLESTQGRITAGMAASHTGIYRVYHYAHRLPHLVLIMRGTVFPDCHACGNKVEFISLLEAELADADYDFTALRATA